MAKPTIVTRASKGAALTWTEGDTNLTNLQDATFSLVAGSGGTTVTSDLNGTVTVIAGTNITLSGDNATKTLTINAAGGSGITDVVQDTTPELGGNLEVANYSLLSDLGDGVRLGSGNVWLNKAATTTGSSYLMSDQTNLQIGVDIQSNYLGGAKMQLNKGVDGGASITANGNGGITLNATGTGKVIANASTTQLGLSATAATLTTNGAGNLVLNTNNGTNSGNITVTAGANGAISITPNGTGKTVISTMNYNEGAIYDLGTTGGTLAPNVTNGNVQKVTLNSALTINAFTSPVAGQSLTLIIYGGTAYTAITSTMKFAGGVKTLTATAGCIDILSVYYDGTTYFASLGKGFA